MVSNGALGISVDNGNLWVGGAVYDLAHVAAVTRWDCWQTIPGRHKMPGLAISFLYVVVLFWTLILIIVAKPSFQEGAWIFMLLAAVYLAGGIFWYSKGTVRPYNIYWHEVRIAVSGAAGVTVAVNDVQWAVWLQGELVRAKRDTRASFSVQVPTVNIYGGQGIQVGDGNFQRNNIAQRQVG